MRGATQIRLYGTKQQIVDRIAAVDSTSLSVLDQIEGIPPKVDPGQALLLYLMASQYNRQDCCLLDIGSARGCSAACMAIGAPKAEILTLEVDSHRLDQAAHNLGRYGNVRLRAVASWDLLEVYQGPRFSMVFVDGDHDEIEKDMPWWNWLTTGERDGIDGLMMWHDYTVLQFPSVVKAVNDLMIQKLGRRELDVSMMDTEGGAGMVGLYRRREGEVW